MGVEIQDASKVASLLGTKIFVDEYISFNRLVEMTKLDEIAVRVLLSALPINSTFLNW